MRITSNMLVQQLVQTAKSEGAQKTEAGSAIIAKITDVLNGVLTLDIGNGKQIVARDLSGQSFYPGQTVTFEVVGFDEGGTLQIRQMEGDAEAGTEPQNLSALLKKLNLPDNEGNRELLKTLSAYRIPLSSENIKAAQNLNVQAKGIVQLTEQTGGYILAEHESEPLKQIAVRLIEIIGSQSKGQSAEAAAMAKPAAGQVAIIPSVVPSGTEGGLKSGGIQNLVPLEDDGSVAVIIQNLLSENANAPKSSDNKLNSEVLKSVLPNAVESESILDSSVKTGQASTVESARGEELKNLLKGLTFEKIAFVIKNQMPGDLGTLDTLDKLITGKKDLGIQLRELLGNLPIDENTASLREGIQNAIKAVHINTEMNPFELQKQLKALNKSLTAIASQSAEAVAGNQNLKESLNEVKSSLDFLGRLSESATYLHVPVNMGQGAKPMDIFVQRDKSGKKKINPKDTRIFISLDTNHMETVQCMVEIQEKKLNIGFKLGDKDALALISRYFEPLKKSLAQLGYNDVMIHGMVYQRPLNLMDITQESPLDLRRIDVRV